MVEDLENVEVCIWKSHKGGVRKFMEFSEGDL